jgi:hypothetical protein
MMIHLPNVVHINQKGLFPFGCRSQLKRKNKVTTVSVYIMKKRRLPQKKEREKKITKSTTDASGCLIAKIFHIFSC